MKRTVLIGIILGAALAVAVPNLLRWIQLEGRVVVFVEGATHGEFLPLFHRSPSPRRRTTSKSGTALALSTISSNRLCPACRFRS